MTRILAPVPLRPRLRVFAQLLSRSRPDSLRPSRSHTSHTVHLQCRWLRGAAADPAGLAGLQPFLVSEGRLDRLHVGARGSADLYRIHPDGTGIERLTDDPAYDDQAAFSPDGARIVFVSTRTGGRANLWILDVATHKATPLTSGNGGDFRPSWSPDGAWIAFSSDRDSDFPPAGGRWERLHLADIYLIHPDGTGLKRISQHGGFCGSPKWTRDSKAVVTYCMSARGHVDLPVWRRGRR